MRLYAIGDVHGCDALLAQVHAKIAADLATWPVADHRIIHLGDFIDRGPESAAVIGRLVELTAQDERVLCLRGNHEAMFLDFLADPIDAGQTFLRNGGVATLASYGVPLDGGFSSMRDLIGLVYTVLEALPVAHRQFIARLPFSFRFGDFFFCHAGIKPGVALEAQDSHDLTWMREPFLSSKADFGAVVIHGHTPAEAPEIHPNRINIDTGAVICGKLTCLAIEGSGYRFL